MFGGTLLVWLIWCLIFVIEGTVLLIDMIKFYRCLKNVNEHGIEIRGEIVETPRRGRYGYAVKPTIAYEFDGRKRYISGFWVKDWHQEMHRGQQVIVIINKRDYNEYLVKENLGSTWYMNGPRIKNKAINIIAVAVCYFIALFWILLGIMLLIYVRNY